MPLQRLLLGLFLLGRLAFFTLVAGTLVLSCIPAPRLLQDATFSPAYTDRQGNLLHLLLAQDDRYRIFVPLDQISPRLIEMTLLHEDRHFYLHPGLNPIALSRAAWFLGTGTGPRVGASTLTMQLVRLHYHLNTRTVSGKIAQILAALHLELHCSKHDILEAYLNLAPYGRNIEGVGAASRIYFNKPARDLSDAEAMTLAVLPQSPARRAPGRHPSDRALRQAREVLLGQWLQQHPSETGLAATLELPLQFHHIGDLPFLAPHLVDQLSLVEHAPKGEVHLALDATLQTVLTRRVHDFIACHKALGIKNGCAILVDYPTMEVRAAVGSAEYQDRTIAGQVNGLQMHRSPGSALKPFIYGLALDQGLIHPLTLLKDGPTNFQGYNPEDFDRDFLGPVSAREALVESRNIPAVALLSQLDLNHSLYQFLVNAGVRQLQPEAHYGLTLALGSAEVSPEDLAGCYATLANRGIWHPLHYTLGESLVPGPTLLSPEASFLTLNMLSTAPRPDAILAGDQVRAPAPIAWKTGTSFSFRDAWCAGVFDDKVLVVWIGNFDGTPNPAFVGRAAAAPLFFSIIDALRARGPAPAQTCFTLTSDLNLRQVEFCADSGGLAGPNCPRREKGWFIPGKSPITPCEVHRLVWIDNKTGRRLPGFPTDTSTAHQAVCEFWPSDFAKLFAAAGLPRQAPPPLDSAAARVTSGEARHGPHILSPRAGYTYQIRLSRGAPETIPLEASAETSRDQLHWFVDSAYLGANPASRPLSWTLAPGQHLIRAVDDSGRADVLRVTVTSVE